MGVEKKCKVGRESCSLRLARRFSSKLWLNQFLRIQRGFFSYLGNYVMSWMLFVLDFVGDKLGRRGKYTGKIGVF